MPKSLHQPLLTKQDTEQSLEFRQSEAKTSKLETKTIDSIIKDKLATEGISEDTRKKRVKEVTHNLLQRLGSDGSKELQNLVSLLSSPEDLEKSPALNASEKEVAKALKIAIIFNSCEKELAPFKSIDLLLSRVHPHNDTNHLPFLSTAILANNYDLTALLLYKRENPNCGYKTLARAGAVFERDKLPAFNAADVSKDMYNFFRDTAKGLKVKTDNHGSIADMNPALLALRVPKAILETSANFANASGRFFFGGEKKTETADELKDRIKKIDEDRKPDTTISFNILYASKNLQEKRREVSAEILEKVQHTFKTRVSSASGPDHSMAAGGNVANNQQPKAIEIQNSTLGAKTEQAPPPSNSIIPSRASSLDSREAGMSSRQI